ncbi:MAG: Wzz/FepE/Etk N-terminal domain-containing protein, partial [Cytophagaceae bacterium]
MNTEGVADKGQGKFFTEEDNYDDFLSDFDIAKLLIVGRKNIVWVILLFFISFSGAFLYKRYTKPIYESSSTLKLDLKSDAGVLGFKNFKDESVQQAAKLTTISGEIELIKSRATFEKVIKRMNLNDSYFSYGSVLFEEKYKTSPFVVDYVIKNPSYYDFKFDLQILNEKEFMLAYKVGSTEISKRYRFEEKIENGDFRFIVKRNSIYQVVDKSTRYFFIINSNEALLAYLASNINVAILNLDANTIKVSFKDHSARKASDIINTIDSVYLQETIDQKTRAFEQTIRFLEKSLDTTEKNLEFSERNMESFVKKHKTFDVRADFVNISKKFESIDNQKLELKIQISLLNDLKDLIETDKDLRVFIPSISKLPDPQLVTTISNLNIIQRDRERLRASYKDTTFAVKQRNIEIENLKATILEL